MTIHKHFCRFIIYVISSFWISVSIQALHPFAYNPISNKRIVCFLFICFNQNAFFCQSLQCAEYCTTWLILAIFWDNFLYSISLLVKYSSETIEPNLKGFVVIFYYLDINWCKKIRNETYRKTNIDFYNKQIFAIFFYSLHIRP